jgi:hypothetical protein
MNHLKHRKSLFSKISSSLLLILLFIFLGIPTYSQLEHGGIPLSFKYPIEGISIPVNSVQPPNREHLEAEDLANPTPYRFAVNLPVADFEWVHTNYPNGEVGWMAIIEAPGAEAITLYFSHFQLPPKGKVFVYNNDRSIVLGAYTDQNQTPNGLFSTSLIPGDQVVVEYNQLASGEPDPEIVVGEIAYAYRGIPDAINSHSGSIQNTHGMKETRGFGSSGPCEVNVNCPEGANWQTEKKGVMRIGVKKGFGTYWCSGSLINNTRQDHTPYILTADHCAQGATPQDISQWIFYFDFESTGCPNPPSSPSWWSLVGGTLQSAAGDVNAGGSDFFLLLLDDEIPDTVDVWFNGWDRSGDASPNGVGIHHPQGDIKKISTYTEPLVSSYWGDPSEMTHWELTWSQTQNGHGVTEGGSSGSPLFDPMGHIVGMLTGGEASCDSSFLNRPDYYGKFFWSWDLNGPNPDQQLKPWLDPDNTGMEILDGLPLGMDLPNINRRQAILFPNPCGDMVTISIPSGSLEELMTISFFDARGVKVWDGQEKSEKNGFISLDISVLPMGFYVVSITSNTFSYRGRLVKLPQ